MMTIRREHRTIHFVGIGGVGMSAIAEVLAARGFTVTGSDARSSVITRRLESLGVKIQYDHEPALVKNADLVVYSSAISSQNPERVFAVAQGMHVMRRAEVLGDLMRSSFTVCIAGTHGKTTTTAIMARVAGDAGRNPTVMVGGLLRELGSTAVVGSGALLIAEADEYDRSFLSMFPSLAVITNIDADHLDCYGTLDAIKDAFAQFANLVPFYGAVIACVDDPGVVAILPRINKPVVTYGIDTAADYRAEEVELTATGSIFTVTHRGKPLGSLSLVVPGRHNILNSLAVVATALEMDISFADAARSCAGFRGVKRRFEVVGCRAGVTVVDDYAHHPTEIAATLAAARVVCPGRVCAVFQPHLYTRTRDLADEFATALAQADTVIVTEIYKAREEPLPGISGVMITERMQRSGHADARFVPAATGVVAALRGRLSDGDMVVLMGAGDIGDTAPNLLEAIGETH